MKKIDILINYANENKLTEAEVILLTDFFNSKAVNEYIKHLITLEDGETVVL